LIMVVQPIRPAVFIVGHDRLAGFRDERRQRI
jgi:hypothetical protein